MHSIPQFTAMSKLCCKLLLPFCLFVCCFVMKSKREVLESEWTRCDREWQQFSCASPQMKLSCATIVIFVFFSLMFCVQTFLWTKQALIRVREGSEEINLETT
jgi:hypothetical protein